MTAELNDGAGEGERVNRKRVARVMRERGLAGSGFGDGRSTVPEPADSTYPDLLERDSPRRHATAKLVGDTTYLPCGHGRLLYLATVIDCYSRRLVGWSIANHMRTELVENALKAAARERGTLAGTTFHSDHGPVNTSKDYAELCADLDVTQPMGARSVPARTTPSRSRSAQPSNARPSKEPPATAAPAQPA